MLGLYVHMARDSHHLSSYHRIPAKRIPQKLPNHLQESYKKIALSIIINKGFGSKGWRGKFLKPGRIFLHIIIKKMTKLPGKIINLL